MQKRAMWIAAAWLMAVVCTTMAAESERSVLHFGVINQRSLALTAEYWNPILEYASARSGVTLRLKMGKTAPETTAQSVRGEHDFVYSNHLFTPERARLGFKVIARFDTPPAQGALVTHVDSHIRSLKALAGKPVVYPSPEAFLGYLLPRAALRQQGVDVSEQFAGNQEGAMARLRSGSAAAAGVSLAVFESYAKRESFSHRVLWSSPPYPDIPVMVHPRVPAATVASVRRALLAMHDDPAGRQVLAQSAAAVGQKQVSGFVKAEDRDYESIRTFYREQVSGGTAR